jgi:hypothetical protein
MVTPAAVIAAAVHQTGAGGRGTPNEVEARTHAKTSLCNIDQS